MHRASAPSAPQASPDYYERLGRLQHGLRDSEKKRLDLEGKLYEYNQSDTCRVKLKYLKLKKYLKEICESEKKARTRNQEYLKRFERVQAHVGHFTTSSEKLQELKVVKRARPLTTPDLAPDTWDLLASGLNLSNIRFPVEPASFFRGSFSVA